MDAVAQGEMILKKYIPLLLSSLMLPTMGAALGLGKLSLHSYLNQKFNADIKLVGVRNMPIGDIRVSFAGPDAYSRLNLEQNEALGKLKISVTKTPRGRPVIHLSSDEQITEPDLQLLLDVTWPEGQYFRVYTVLLDPPSYHARLTKPAIKDGDDIAPVFLRAPVAHEPIPYKPNLPPVSKNTTPQRPTINTPKVEVSASIQPTIIAHTTRIYGPIKANTSLWKVAKEIRPNQSVSIDQTLLAILAKNPKAFLKNNINGLEAGASLSIPSLAEIQSIPRKGAYREVKAHNIAWNTKQPIKHRINPPYIHSNVVKMAQAKQQKRIKPKTNQPKPPAINSTELKFKAEPRNTIEASPFMSQAPRDESDMAKTLRAELAVSARAFNSAENTNQLLRKELSRLDGMNKVLQQQIAEKDSEIIQLHDQYVSLEGNMANDSFYRQSNPFNVMGQLAPTGQQLWSLTPNISDQASGTSYLAEHQGGWTLLLSLMLLSFAAASGMTWLLLGRQKIPVMQMADSQLTSDVSDFAGDDLVATQLDMAVAYMNMKDNAQAKALLELVLASGDDSQRIEADRLMNDLEENKK